MQDETLKNKYMQANSVGKLFTMEHLKNAVSIPSHYDWSIKVKALLDPELAALLIQHTDIAIKYKNIRSRSRQNANTWWKDLHEKLFENYNNRINNKLINNRYLYAEQAFTSNKQHASWCPDFRTVDTCAAIRYVDVVRNEIIELDPDPADDKYQALEDIIAEVNSKYKEITFKLDSEKQAIQKEHKQKVHDYRKKQKQELTQLQASVDDIEQQIEKKLGHEIIYSDRSMAKLFQWHISTRHSHIFIPTLSPFHTEYWKTALSIPNTYPKQERILMSLRSILLPSYNAMLYFYDNHLAAHEQEQHNIKEQHNYIKYNILSVKNAKQKEAKTDLKGLKRYCAIKKEQIILLNPDRRNMEQRVSDIKALKRMCALTELSIEVRTEAIISTANILLGVANHHKNIKLIQNDKNLKQRSKAFKEYNNQLDDIGPVCELPFLASLFSMLAIGFISLVVCTVQYIRHHIHNPINKSQRAPLHVKTHTSNVNTIYNTEPPKEYDAAEYTDEEYGEVEYTDEEYNNEEYGEVEYTDEEYDTDNTQEQVVHYANTTTQTSDSPQSTVEQHDINSQSNQDDMDDIQGELTYDTDYEVDTITPNNKPTHTPTNGEMDIQGELLYNPDGKYAPTTHANTVSTNNKVTAPSHIPQTIQLNNISSIQNITTARR